MSYVQNNLLARDTTAVNKACIKHKVNLQMTASTACVYHRVCKTTEKNEALVN